MPLDKVIKQFPSLIRLLIATSRPISKSNTEEQEEYVTIIWKSVPHELTKKRPFIEVNVFGELYTELIHFQLINKNVSSIKY